MTLPEQDGSIFELFIDWLYHQRYEIPSPPEEPSKDYDRFEQPVKLFVLADMYDVRDLKNHVLSAIFLLLKQREIWPSLRTVAYAYEHTPHNSTIRKLLADYMSHHTKLEGLQRLSAQDWLRNHPDISAALNVSFAKMLLTKKSPLDGEMSEEYMDRE